MNQIKSEIEIQAVNLAQQWFSLPHDQLPECSDLLDGYMRCFHETEDQQAFVKESLRIIEELVHSPKYEGVSGRSVDALRHCLEGHLLH